MSTDNSAVLDQIDTYCDEVPRASCELVEVHGPLTLFVAHPDGWPFYARPTRLATTPSIRAMQAVIERQRELRRPPTFEWIAELQPDYADVVEAMGIAVERYPLLVLPADVSVPTTTSSTTRIVDPDADPTSLISSVATVAFTWGGTQQGPQGLTEAREAAAMRPAALVERERTALRDETVVAAATFIDGLPVTRGVHLPRATTTEIAGIGTLPTFRRSGYGAAVVSVLVNDARSRGITTIFLSAENDEIARVYERLGFVRIGTACAADADVAADSSAG